MVDDKRPPMTKEEWNKRPPYEYNKVDPERDKHNLKMFAERVAAKFEKGIKEHQQSHWKEK